MATEATEVMGATERATEVKGSTDKITARRRWHESVLVESINT